MTKKRIILVPVIGLVAIVAYYLASPLFINVTVSEPLTGESGTILRGEFVNADGFHTAEGVAKILRVGGTLSLRFEEFKVRNGPDLFVYLSEGRDVSKGFVNLGSLKGNIGNQNYDVAQSTDLDRFRVVVIWCRAFSTPFGYAELTR